MELITIAVVAIVVVLVVVVVVVVVVVGVIAVVGWLTHNSASGRIGRNHLCVWSG